MDSGSFSTIMARAALKGLGGMEKNFRFRFPIVSESYWVADPEVLGYLR